MLRAAASGSFDYRGADPYDKQWRIRHTLAIRETDRALGAEVLKIAHDHWLAYVTHSRLEEDSWKKSKQHAYETMQSLKAAILPWQKTEKNTAKKDTIEAKYGDLIAKYKKMKARKAAERAAAANDKSKEKQSENS